MNTSEKHPLPKKDFEILAESRDLYCVSIFLPMDKKGREQNLHLAQALLKQCINEVKKTLSEHQMHMNEIDEYLKPAEQLLDKVELWRNPSDGLAIFLDSENGMRYYTLPIPFEAKTYVANHFYLLPLLPLYHNDGLYYLLDLSQDYVKLYEASHYSFKDMYLEDFAPGQLEDAVGFDYEQKNLQFRSGQATHGASFHGQGAGKEDEKDELSRYLRMLDKGVKKIVSDSQAPLVLSCTDRLYALYTEANTHHNLFDKHLPGDPEYKKDDERHRESWVLVEEYFQHSQFDKINEFNEQYHTKKTSYELDVIVNAALNGKIDTLFIEEGGNVFGIYDKKDNEVSIDEKHEINNVSLTNLAALQTFKQGGSVYFLPSEQMPVKESSMNAVFRY
ncbi:MAG: hypothetical protein ABJJ25_13020 [Eudoraea sp.]|uniref:baeRF7 domain-containing protein n=1 Tax=Eudoraea sp. TaxID=1979955 RepID=UPI003263C6BA